MGEESHRGPFTKDRGRGHTSGNSTSPKTSQMIVEGPVISKADETSHSGGEEVGRRVVVDGTLGGCWEETGRRLKGGRSRERSHSL